jgi:hypothetical protein
VSSGRLCGAVPILVLILHAASCGGGATGITSVDGAADAGQADVSSDDILETTSIPDADDGGGGVTPDGADSSGVQDGPDSEARCNPNAPFGSPVLLPGPYINTTAQEGGPRLTADELTLYFSRDTGSPNKSDLFVAHRARTSDDFGPSSPLTTVNSTSNEYDPSTVTGLTLFFTSDRLDGHGLNDLYFANRGDMSSDFAPPIDLPSPLNSTASDAQPALRADGSELWFASNRAAPGFGKHDIYRAAAAGTSFDPPVLVAEISSPFEDFTPTLSNDGLIVFFASNRAQAGSQDIWTASRARPTDPFSDVYAVAVLNSTYDDYPGWLSADGCRLYMSSTRPGAGDEDIYIATRGQ